MPLDRKIRVRRTIGVFAHHGYRRLGNGCHMYRLRLPHLEPRKIQEIGQQPAQAIAFANYQLGEQLIVFVGIC